MPEGKGALIGKHQECGEGECGPDPIPLLFVKEGEQGAAWNILCDNGKLAGVIQAGAHELNYTGVVELCEDGHLSAKHIHV